MSLKSDVQGFINTHCKANFTIKIDTYDTISANIEKTDDAEIVAGNNDLIVRDFMKWNSVSFDYLIRSAEKIDSWYRGKTVYRKNALESDLWCQLYQVLDAHPLPVMEGTTAKTRNHRAIACYDCGFIFPLKRITIDHQKPQEGGTFQAVTKVFRVLGLTMGSSTGAKGKALAKNFQNPMIEPTPVPVNQSGKNNDFWLSSAFMKNSFNHGGIALYSIAKFMKADIDSMCLHSLINLKPLCGYCNSKKNNNQVDLARYL